MNFLQQINAIWKNVSLVQKALLIAIVLTFAIIAVVFTQWMKKPEMVVMYHQLEPEEAAKITSKLTERNISYELQNGGTTIYVPKDKMYQLRLDMAKEGLASGANLGYKLFDDEKIGISPFVQNINFRRALQDELAKSIQMIDGVEFCRVHIVKNEQSIFGSEGSDTSAAIVLKLKPGLQLSGQNAAAITHLVAGSVEGLKPESVTVVDDQGRLLSSKDEGGISNSAGTAQDYKERVERNLSEKAERMLTTALGPGRATVKVSAIIDMTSINLVTESYDPSKKVATKEEIKTNSENSGGPVAENGKSSGGTKKDEAIVTEYQVGKTVEQKVEMPGTVKSLSVAAIVDLSVDDVNATENKKSTIMEIADVEAIIKNALGLKDTDSIKVVPVKFYRPTALLGKEKQSNWSTYITIARQGSLGILAVCALVVLKIFSGAKKKTKATEQTPANAGMPALSAGGPAGLLPLPANSDPMIIRRQIASALQTNPEQVKQLFTSWIEEKGE